MGTVPGHTLRSADGTRIACRRYGSGPPLVVVDGAGCWSGFNSQRPLAELLAADLTVVTYDRRGRGASTDTPPYSIAREVEDLRAVIGWLGPAAAVHGVSSGALLALHAAAVGVPVTRLSLVEPPLADPPGPSALTAELTALVAAGRHRAAALRYLASTGVPPGVVDQRGPAMAALAAVAPTLVHDCVLRDAATLEVARRVRVPALVLDGGGVPTGCAAAVAAALPRGHHRRLAGRWPEVTDADVAAALREFLRCP